MKQVLIRKGTTVVAEVPSPRADTGSVLVGVRASCISPGTEGASVASSGRSLLRRAIEQPDKAKAAVERMRRDGVNRVLREAWGKVDDERATGYSAAGVVKGVGPGVEGFRIGDRVAVAGAGSAVHAEEVVVPVNLTVPLPADVDFAEGSTVALGAISLQGVRRSEASLGEFVVVTGCGALGLLTVQILKACGCRVVGVDVDDGRLEKAVSAGAERVMNVTSEDAARSVFHTCNGRGADAVIITASTDSSEPLLQAFRMCRRKGRVVLVGVVGREFDREEMYGKELDFVISTSYGPGRYDDDYERRGQDYPYGYVRWTEGRNMQAYLHLLATGQVRVDHMIEARYPVAKAEEAFAGLAGEARPLLAVLTYPGTDEPGGAPAPAPAPAAQWRGPQAGVPVGVALIGAGSFVSKTHVPNLLRLQNRFAVRYVIDREVTAARNVSRLLPGCAVCSDAAAALGDTNVQMVIVGTRHDSHAALALDALRAGKAVLVEKPMCLSPDECEALREALEGGQIPFMVGYNRRFSPFARAARERLARRVNPVILHYTMNAGYIPYDHWTQTAEGGGRIIGEACHILDLFRYLVGHAAVSLHVGTITPATASVRESDNMCLTMQYEDGSVASLVYASVGSTDSAKERMEAFFDETSIILDDYRSINIHGSFPQQLRRRAQDKGHFNELARFGDAVRAGETYPIPLAELLETWRLSYQAAEAARTGQA